MLTKEQFKKDLKKIMIQENITQKNIADIRKVTPASVSQQMNAASWRYIDLVNLLDKLGYDVVWVKRHNAK